MNTENKQKIMALVSLCGNIVKEEKLLLPNRKHQTRNSYAHFWGLIKDKYGKSYKDLPDEKFTFVVNLILNEMSLLYAIKVRTGFAAFMDKINHSAKELGLFQ